MVEKLVPDPFMKSQNWANLWIYSLKCYKFVFILCLSRIPSKYNKTTVLNSCFHLIKACKEQGSLPHFLHDFWTKIFLT